MPALLLLLLACGAFARPQPSDNDVVTLEQLHSEGYDIEQLQSVGYYCKCNVSIYSGNTCNSFSYSGETTGPDGLCSSHTNLTDAKVTAFKYGANCAFMEFYNQAGCQGGYKKFVSLPYNSPSQCIPYDEGTSIKLTCHSRPVQKTPLSQTCFCSSSTYSAYNCSQKETGYSTNYVPRNQCVNYGSYSLKYSYNCGSLEQYIGANCSGVPFHYTSLNGSCVGSSRLQCMPGSNAAPSAAPSIPRPTPAPFPYPPTPSSYGCKFVSYKGAYCTGSPTGITRSITEYVCAKVSVSGNTRYLYAYGGRPYDYQFFTSAIKCYQTKGAPSGPHYDANVCESVGSASFKLEC